MAEQSHEHFLLFPEAELVALAEHFDLIAQAWPPVTANGRRLRSEHQARAQVCRDAIIAYRQLAGLPPLLLQRGEIVNGVEGGAGDPSDVEVDAQATARAD